MAKLLLVEDDEALSVVVENALRNEKHTVDIATDGKYGLELLLNYPYDLAILDWDLPNVAGIDICKEHRKNGGKTAILFLTGKTDYASRVTGLDSGADDYLVKPFDRSELLARVRAILRRHSGVKSNLLTVGAIAYDSTSKEAFFQGNLVKFSRRELALLEFFLRHPNEVFNAQTLVERVWSSESEVSPETVRPYILKMRTKLTDKDGKCSLVTVHGSGYKLIPE